MYVPGGMYKLWDIHKRHKMYKGAKTTDDFKTQLKGWIWKNIH